MNHGYCRIVGVGSPHRITTAAVLTVVTILFVAPVSGDESAEYQQRVQALSTEIKRISQRLNKDRALLKSEQDKLLQVEQKLLAQRTKVSDSRAAINRAEQRQQALRTEVQQLEQQHGDDLDQIAELLRLQHRQGKANYLKMLLNQENPYAVGRLQNYYSYVARAQHKHLQALTDRLQTVRLARQQQQQQLTELQTLQQQLSSQQQQLSKTKLERQQRVAQLDSAVGDQQSRLKKLQQDRARLGSLLQEIARQAAELERLQSEEQIRQQNGRDASNRGFVPRAALVTGGFVKQRGRLIKPVSGRLKQSFGQRIAESGMRAEGWLFETEGSVDVAAIFRGRVLFADFLKGYGLLMIIDHGDDHISLYGHNRLLYKKVGDMVASNEVIAKTGVTGGLKTPGLYFEIRNNTSPVDPSIWCRS